MAVKTKVEILQNFVAFSEYMNFNIFSIYECFRFVSWQKKNALLKTFDPINYLSTNKVTVWK